jgi:hypothetical protein
LYKELSGHSNGPVTAALPEVRKSAPETSAHLPDSNLAPSARSGNEASHRYSAGRHITSQ